MLNQQEYYRDLYKNLKPSWEKSMEIYKKLIDDSLKKDQRILDIGCGHGEFLKDTYSKTSETFGIDPDKDALAKNTFIKNKVIASAESLPFQNNFFDVITSAWVLEHLDHPIEVFSEIYRVLKPGGKVIFITPNAWNYNAWIIRTIPNRFHEFFTRHLYGRKENDTYPVRYRINTIKKVNKILTSLGFKEARLILNGDPSYISFNKPLFYFACFLEKLLDIKALHFMKVHLIGAYTK